MNAKFPNTSKLNNIKNEAIDKSAEYEDALSNIENKAADLLHKTTKKIEEKATEAQKYLATYIKDNPLKSIGFSLLAGILITTFIKK